MNCPIESKVAIAQHQPLSTLRELLIELSTELGAHRTLRTILGHGGAEAKEAATSAHVASSRNEHISHDMEAVQALWVEEDRWDVLRISNLQEYK